MNIVIIKLHPPLFEVSCAMNKPAERGKGCKYRAEEGGQRRVKKEKKKRPDRVHDGCHFRLNASSISFDKNDYTTKPKLVTIFTYDCEITREILLSIPYSQSSTSSLIELTTPTTLLDSSNMSPPLNATISSFPGLTLTPSSLRTLVEMSASVSVLVRDGTLRAACHVNK